MSDKIFTLSQTPFVRIIEQPARGGTRFRYECEGRSAGSIPGVNSTPDITTYPAIQVTISHIYVVNYTGSALAIVSCVTKDFPYRQHPHNLVGERCTNGISKMIVDNKDMIATFPSMGIQCAKRNDIRVRLKRRQALQIDPFDCGFDHMNCSSFEINLSAVRLCFQVLLEDPKTGQYSIPLQPVVSDVIFDKKSCNELNVIDISSNTISTNGSKLMLFTSFVLRDDIEVRFYELDDQNAVKWQDFGVIAFIYRHIGISLLTPKYIEPINEEKVVYLQLRRPSDHELSAPIKLRLIHVSDHDMDVSQSTPSLITKISRPSQGSSSLSSSRKKLCGTSDSWKEIVLKKPDFPFPILKAAIKREIFVNPLKSHAFEMNPQTHNPYNYNHINNNNMKCHQKELCLTKAYSNSDYNSQSMLKYNNHRNISTNTTTTQRSYDINDDQNLVIDLTTGFDATKHYAKQQQHQRIDECNSRRSPPQRHPQPTTHQDVNDFCCQVNTMDDTDIDVEANDDSNDSSGH
ncbi:unnamed protein product [Medioppia subpectinata]|uniref:RHD domain-containing protein n=1 Tax=Medioppia subpectinata TaxID=1979941 RepID=A0A7R9KVU7_9ACAR|nr:unnamed protein product [Medioppia subpectinata]CAG2110415.1 unnamed protein product [Medioppia subpectinata]